MSDPKPENAELLMASATPRRWQVADSYSGDRIEIAGWDWGGEGPLLIASHANGFCAALWQPVVKRLGNRFRVVAIDARGHGDSASPPAPNGYVWDYFASDLAQVAQQLLTETGQSQVHCGVGSSFGGIVTAAAAARYEGLFARVAMFDPPIHPSPEQRRELGLAPTQPPDIAEQARRRSAIWPSRAFARDKWQGKPMFAAWLPEAFELYLAEGFRDREDGRVELKCHPEVEATIFATTGSLDTFEIAPAVTAPVLLVQASQGHVPASVFERLAPRFPRCTFRVADAGHLMPLEDPDLVVHLLDNFLTSS